MWPSWHEMVRRARCFSILRRMPCRGSSRRRWHCKSVFDDFFERRRSSPALRCPRQVDDGVTDARAKRADSPGPNGSIQCAINALDEGKLRTVLEAKDTYDDTNADRDGRMVEKTAAFRQRRAADTARWRERLNRGAVQTHIEIAEPSKNLSPRA